ncbi:hypothetical protein [Streptomyces sp. NL15-2K]|uniref:hypothetical protein n=1 Tax=Streptomyces sp. NL15-2K TaxID=376149 RepID=UPI000F56EA76|nr:MULTISPECIES: hypothetical protein [Actinomycetes]WKX09979.1 hypothetical protein Q4V64_21790 [Kutzneria buriramensis]
MTVIINSFMVAGIILSILLQQWNLKSARVRIAVIAWWAISAFVAIAIAVDLALNASLLQATFPVIAALLFLIEAAAASKWKLGEKYPPIQDWFKR